MTIFINNTTASRSSNGLESINCCICACIGDTISSGLIIASCGSLCMRVHLVHVLDNVSMQLSRPFDRVTETYRQISLYQSEDCVGK